MEWEKLPENDIYDKELMFKICEEFLQLRNKKRNNLIKKWSKDLNRQHIYGQQGYEKKMFNPINH